MNDVPDNAGLETFTYCRADAQHFKATYGFTCHQVEDRIVFRFVRVDGHDPARIEWSIPIQGGYQGILIKVLDDGTLKLVGLPDYVVTTKLRPQE